MKKKKKTMKSSKKIAYPEEVIEGKESVRNDRYYIVGEKWSRKRVRDANRRDFGSLFVTCYMQK